LANSSSWTPVQESQAARAPDLAGATAVHRGVEETQVREAAEPGAKVPDRSTAEAQILIGDESALLSIHTAFKVPACSIMEILCDLNNTAVRVRGRVNSSNLTSVTCMIAGGRRRSSRETQFFPASTRAWPSAATRETPPIMLPRSVGRRKTQQVLSPSFSEWVAIK